MSVTPVAVPSRFVAVGRDPSFPRWRATHWDDVSDKPQNVDVNLETGEVARRRPSEIRKILAQYRIPTGRVPAGHVVARIRVAASGPRRRRRVRRARVARAGPENSPPPPLRSYGLSTVHALCADGRTACGLHASPQDGALCGRCRRTLRPRAPDQGPGSPRPAQADRGLRVRRSARRPASAGDEDAVVETAARPRARSGVPTQPPIYILTHRATIFD